MTPSWQSIVINVGVRHTWSTHDFVDLAYNTFLPHIITIGCLLGLSLSRASSGKWLDGLLVSVCQKLDPPILVVTEFLFCVHDSVTWRVGVSESIIQKSDPFKRQYCSDRANCMVRRVEGSRGWCWQSGVMYKIECVDHVYIGETSRNASTRPCENTKSQDKKKED